MKVRLISAVWGEAFVDVFLRLSLRTLLAAGNILEVTRRADTRYTIFTTAAGAEQMKRSPVFLRLEEAVEVDLNVFDPSEIDTNFFGSHDVLWARAVDLAQRNKEFVFFLIPDCLYADGTLSRWLDRLEAGSGAVYSLGPQVVLETILDEIEGRDSSSGQPGLSLSERDISDLLFRHLHPLAATMLRNSPFRISHPEHEIRSIPARGMVFRSFTSHPFCLDPARYEEIRSYNPCDHLDSLSFERCSVISAEPLMKHAGSYYRPWTMNEDRLSNLGAWWDQFGKPANLVESTQAHVISYDGTELSIDARPAILASRFFRFQVAQSRAIFRLFERLRNAGLFEAAKALATAQFVIRLRRKLALRPGGKIYVPCDGAFRGADGERIKALMAEGREAEVLALLRNHIVEADRDVTKAGQPVMEVLKNADVLGEQLLDGDIRLYEIDRILWLDEQPVGKSKSSQAPAAPAGSGLRMRLINLLRKPEALILGGDVPTAWARQSPVHRLIFLLFHLPGLELLLAVVFPVYFRRYIFDLLRPYYRRLQHIGALTRIREFVIQARRKNLLAAWNAAMVSPREQRGGREAAMTEAGISALRLFQYLRQRGPRATVGRIRWSLAWRLNRRYASRRGRHKMTPSDESRFGAIRLLRALCAADDILSYYEKAVLVGRASSTPRQLIARIIGDRGTKTAEASHALADLASLYPTVADLHLERGWECLDRGDREAARLCFMAAATSKAAADQRLEFNPFPLAAAELARISAADGNIDQAIGHYRRARRGAPNRRVLAIEYGRLLRRRGHTREAMFQFEDGMAYDGSAWSVPSLPRDVRTLGDLLAQIGHPTKE